MNDERGRAGRLCVTIGGERAIFFASFRVYYSKDKDFSVLLCFLRRLCGWTFGIFLNSQASFYLSLPFSSSSIHKPTSGYKLENHHQITYTYFLTPKQILIFLSGHKPREKHQHLIKIDDLKRVEWCSVSSWQWKYKCSSYKHLLLNRKWLVCEPTASNATASTAAQLNVCLCTWALALRAGVCVASRRVSYFHSCFFLFSLL